MKKRETGITRGNEKRKEKGEKRIRKVKGGKVIIKGKMGCKNTLA